MENKKLQNVFGQIKFVQANFEFMIRNRCRYIVSAEVLVLPKIISIV